MSIPWDLSSHFHFGESSLPILQLKHPSCWEKGYRGKGRAVQCDSLGAHAGSRSSKMCRVGKACSCAGLGTASESSCLPASSIYGLKGQKRQGLPWLWESSSQEMETWLQKAAVPQLCQAVGAVWRPGESWKATGSAGQGLPGCLLCRLCLQMCQPGSLPLCHEQSLQPSPTVWCHQGCMVTQLKPSPGRIWV